MGEKEYQAFLNFWFSEPVEKLWFNSTPEFDQELKEKFENLYTSAFQGEYEEWRNDVYGGLALVILFDQLPLNIYRKTPKSFQAEAKAREIAHQLIEKNWDKELDDSKKAFLYMPFMHSENIQDQEISVALYEKAGLENNLKFAKHHHDIVARFGRFPHRNAILGRESTPAEREYLASKEAFLG